MRKGIRKRIGRHLSLTVSLVLFVFGVLVAGILLAGLLIVILHITGTLPLWDGSRLEPANGGRAVGAILAMMLFSTVLGTAMAAFFSKKALNPIRKVVKATNQVARGDFSVRVDIKGIHELEELSRSFNKMVAELSSIEAMRMDFVNTFSHELKTPVVSVRGFAKLLKESGLSEAEKQEYLDIIIAESERLAALSTNVLSLSKYENTEIVPDKSTYRLDEQVRRVIVQTEPGWSGKEITVEVELEEICFEANEDLVAQIWLNLMDNAIKFSNKGGTINVRLARRDGGVMFRIRDDGIGMGEETISHIFDKFYQGDISRAGAGNGLGLPIVKRIVELHAGTMEVESEPGRCSVFSVFF